LAYYRLVGRHYERMPQPDGRAARRWRLHREAYTGCGEDKRQLLSGNVRVSFVVGKLAVICKYALGTNPLGVTYIDYRYPLAIHAAHAAPLLFPRRVIIMFLRNMIIKPGTNVNSRYQKQISPAILLSKNETRQKKASDKIR
jgi:hypothetical protein